jgi:type I restriction enzyme M protein
LKKVRPRNEAIITEAESKVASLLKDAREATNKSEGIENAVFDLKSVNPNRKVDVDRRSPPELLDLIEAKGRDVAAAVADLRSLTRIE